MSELETRSYDHIGHHALVEDLWQRVFGSDWPLPPRRVLEPRIVCRDRWEPGDEQIVLDDGRAVAFGQVEIERTSSVDKRVPGSITLLMVDPDHRCGGLGGRLLVALEGRLRQAGCKSAQIGGLLNRFWTGIPDETPLALNFFRSHGYVLDQAVNDLVVDLSSVNHSDGRFETNLQPGFTISPATDGDVIDLFAFEGREFPNWLPSLIRMINAGDLSNNLIMRHGGHVCGTIQAFPPDALWRGPNLVWESVFGNRLGGYGSVGIGKAWRKRGLGVALCRYANAYLKSRGASKALIDWTGVSLLKFYAQAGARPWKLFWRGKRDLHAT